jgi:hypothetical protein
MIENPAFEWADSPRSGMILREVTEDRIREWILFDRNSNARIWTIPSILFSHFPFSEAPQRTPGKLMDRRVLY